MDGQGAYYAGHILGPQYKTLLLEKELENITPESYKAWKGITA
jgi:hypothetical protein